MSTSGAHILVYTYPSSGHIIPLLDLTHQLLTRGLTITVLVTPNNLPLLDPLFSCHDSSQLHHLVLPAPDNSQSTPKTRVFDTMRSMRDRHYPLLLDWFKSHTSPPVAIISDFFLGWTHEFACQVGVPRIVFSPTGAFSYAFAGATWRDLPQNDDPENLDLLVSFPGLPNSPSCPWWQITHLYRMAKQGDPGWEFYRQCRLANAVSWGIVFNTFTELERVYLEYEKSQFADDRVWAVGPLLPPNDDLMGSANRGGPNSVPCHEVLTWLDSREEHSVVYVCFGSRVCLTCKQVEELSAALERSGVDFIWCLRQPNEAHASGDYGVVQDGFEDRVAGRGFVIRGWAPQMAILRHRAVGSFFTHCGWNSVIEGIATGVVMLTWPMDADQFTNSHMLVDQLGVGIRVGEASRTIPNSDALAKILVESLGVNRSERVKAKKMKEAALSAVKGGSSDKDLDQLVKTLNGLKA